jgi:hypothetical protein
MRLGSRMLMTLFSHTAEFRAEFLGDIGRPSDHHNHIDQDVGPRSISGRITVTPGFTMLLVRDMIEFEESRIVALDLTPADDNAKELFMNLIELLNPPTDGDIENSEDDKDENLGYDSAQDCSDYGGNCGIVKSERFPKFDGSYIVTIPAGSGNIPKFLDCMEWLPQNRSRPLLLLLLRMKD